MWQTCQDYVRLGECSDLSYKTKKLHFFYVKHLSTRKLQKTMKRKRILVPVQVINFKVNKFLNRFRDAQIKKILIIFQSDVWDFLKHPGWHWLNPNRLSETLANFLFQMNWYKNAKAFWFMRFVRLCWLRLCGRVMRVSIKSKVDFLH